MPPKKFGRDTEEGSDSLALEPLPSSEGGAGEAGGQPSRQRHSSPPSPRADGPSPPAED